LLDSDHHQQAFFSNLEAENPISLIKLENGRLSFFERTDLSRNWRISKTPIDLRLSKQFLITYLEDFWRRYVYKFKSRIMLGFIAYDALEYLENFQKKISLKKTKIFNFPNLYFAVFSGYRFKNFSKNQAEPIKTEIKTRKVEHLVKDSEYKKSVQSALEYIKAGEIYQINLSRPILIELESQNHLEIYKSVTKKNPNCNYLAYLPIVGKQGTTHSVISASPECFLKKTKQNISTFPIKGTRPKIFSSKKKDLKIQEELQNNKKEKAEHLMIVDLERNDLGKLAIPGTVKVKKFKDLQSFSYAHHLVSEISCKIDKEKNIFDVLRETFPSGSITGAPKMRTIQIIEELEQFPRQAYTGVLGYVDSQGDALFSILIRSLLVRQTKMILNVGGGVVYDSDPDFESAETHLKSRFFLDTK